MAATSRQCPTTRAASTRGGGRRRSHGKRQRLGRIGIGRVRDDIAGEPRLAPDAVKPRTEIPARGKLEIRVGRYMAVSKNRYVGDRIGVARNERPPCELAVEHIER